ncbi:hypothetical protein AURDEDRAFT_159821 [Auricularia subglabra TFB-10046 SS5]|nr:hypothetical protein AURDEDRAFT_159821 [Auricularia subglabra TFB-10046 SS5]
MRSPAPPTIVPPLPTAAALPLPTVVAPAQPTITSPHEKLDERSSSPLSPCLPSAQPSKRRAISPPSPNAEGEKYPGLRSQRRRDVRETAEGKRRRVLQDFSRELLAEVRDRFSDALDGKDTEALSTWEVGYTELWELLEERDTLAEQVDKQRKENDLLTSTYKQREERLNDQVNLLTIQCEVFEGELNRLKKRYNALQDIIQRDEFIPGFAWYVLDLSCLSTC